VAAKPPERELKADRAMRLGLQNAFWLGFGGEFTDPVPAYMIGLDFGFPAGRSVRYHVVISYQTLSGQDGFRLNPLTVGYAIPAWNGAFSLEVEVLATILQGEAWFKNGFYTAALGSGLSGQVVLNYGLGFVAFAPLGFEVRYIYAHGKQDFGLRTGVGVNWPMTLTLGVEL
jgi:hypothetical protein